MRALVLIAAVGCARVPVNVRSETVIDAAAELRLRGSADVFDDEGDVVGADDELTLHPGDHVQVAKADFTIRSLLADCPEGPVSVDAELRKQYPRCLLFSHADVTVGVKREVEWGNIAIGAGVVALAGLVYCTAECSSPYSKISGGMLFGVGVLAVVGVFEIIHVVSHND